MSIHETRLGRCQSAKGTLKAFAFFFSGPQKRSLMFLQKLSMGKELHPPDTIHPFEMFIEVTRNVFQMESHRSILFFFS